SLTLCAHALNNLYDKYLFNEHQEHGHHHGPVSSLTHPFGPFRRMVPLVAAHDTDGKTEHDGFQYERKHIEESHRFKHLVEIYPEAGVFHLVNAEKCAQQTYGCRITR